MRIQLAKGALILIFPALLTGCAASYFPTLKNLEHERFHKDGIAESRNAILIEQGRYLLAVRQHEEILAGAEGDGFFPDTRYRRFCNEVETVSKQLYEIGLQAFEKNENSAALEAATISNSLSPDQSKEKLVLRIWRQRQEEFRESRKNETAEAENQWPGLVNEFRQLLNAGDVAGASRTAAKMKKIDSQKAAPYCKRINRRINWEVRSLLSQGQRLYAQGYIREAIGLWQKALELKPEDPELVQNIGRARRFLENIDKWGNERNQNK